MLEKLILISRGIRVGVVNNGETSWIHSNQKSRLLFETLSGQSLFVLPAESSPPQTALFCCILAEQKCAFTHNVEEILLI